MLYSKGIWKDSKKKTLKMIKILLGFMVFTLAQCASKPPPRPKMGSEADYLYDNGVSYKLQKPYIYTLQRWKPTNKPIINYGK